MRSGILFDAQGIPISLDTYALDDFDALLNVADAYGLQVIPVLFDYTLANGVIMEGTSLVGEHPNVITNTVDRMALINIVKPIIQRYRTRSTIYAWDIMNEPEYVSAAPEADVDAFIHAFVEMIHAEAPDALVTVGCRNCGDLVRWKNSELDLYQFHYYDNMVNEYPLDTPVASLELDKPVLVGECQPTDVEEKLDTIARNGYLGILFWSLNADYDFHSVADLYNDWCHDMTEAN